MSSGRYQLLEEIGRGSMGVVFRANDRLNRQTVAYKRVAVFDEENPSPSSLTGPSSISLRQRHGQEFRTLSALRHPNIVTVLDYGFDDSGLPFYTMEHLAGARDVLQASNDAGIAGHESLKWRAELLMQVFDALGYLHRCSVVHRDLKPENVLVTGRKVNLVDFGLATLCRNDDTSGGTLAYLAPEIWREEPYTESADLYSVGVMAYQMFAGEHPFDVGEHHFVEQVLTEHPRLDRIEPNGPAGDRLRGVLARLLDKDPGARFETAESCASALAAAVGVEPLPSALQLVTGRPAQTAFVGRTEEISTLAHAMKDARQGTGSAWLISGASGVGKSRLLEELQTMGLVDGALILKGQAIEERTGSPYASWGDIVRSLALESDVSDLEVGVLQEIAPDLGVMLDRGISRVPRLTGPEGRARLIDFVVDLFRRQSRWMVLVLEDLQWAIDSYDLVARLADASWEIPLLIVATMRGDDPPTDARLSEFQAISLAPFSEREIELFSASALGKRGGEASLLDRLYRETGGNALQLTQLIRSFSDAQRYSGQTTTHSGRQRRQASHNNRSRV